VQRGRADQGVCKEPPAVGDPIHHVAIGQLREYEIDIGGHTDGEAEREHHQGAAAGTTAERQPSDHREEQKVQHRVSRREHAFEGR
jgi:hypothetical protein